MGNVQTSKRPSGKVVSTTAKPLKMGLKTDTLVVSTDAVSSGSSSNSTAPTTPDHLTGPLPVPHKSKKYMSFNLRQTSTTPNGKRFLSKMTSETEPTEPNNQTFSKEDDEERRKAAVVLQVSLSIPIVSFFGGAIFPLSSYPDGLFRTSSRSTMKP